MHLLDTSALCAHFLGEPGADTVEKLLQQPEEVGVCVLSWFEMRFVLPACGVTAANAAAAVRLYRALPLMVCEINETIVDGAVALRSTATARLPMTDALIAACAQQFDARGAAGGVLREPLTCRPSSSR